MEQPYMTEFFFKSPTGIELNSRQRGKEGIVGSQIIFKDAGPIYLHLRIP